MAHGTPESVDQMAEYLRLVRGGREPSAELIEEMTPQLARHRRPLAAHRHHAAAGGARCRRSWPATGLAVPVAVGMRNWKPVHRRRHARDSGRRGADTRDRDSAGAAVFHAERPEIHGRREGGASRRTSSSPACGRFTITRC